MKYHSAHFPLLLACSAAFFLSDATAKLVAWYPLDDPPTIDEFTIDAAGTNNAEFVGFDPDPTFSSFTNPVISARPNLGTAYCFDLGGGLDIFSTPASQPTDQFTISFWFQPKTLAPFDRLLESQVDNDNSQDGLRIDLGPGDRVRVLVRDGNGASNQLFLHPITLRDDGTWYFFAFRYDSQSIDAPFEVTVIEASQDNIDDFDIADGTGGPATINTGPIGFPHASASTFIGAENSGGGNGINASIDEIAFFDNSDNNGVLSDLQLADIYNFGPSGVELISSFTSDVVNVPSGGNATLSWDVMTPFDSLVLTDGSGTIVDLAPLTTAGTGSITVSPTARTFYSLRATRGDAANVSSIDLLANSPPNIAFFTASESIVLSGDPVDLTWVIAAGQSIEINPGAVDVTALTSFTVFPTETTTYTISAMNDAGTTTAETTVSIIAPPLPANRYVASTPGNTDTSWVDEIGESTWVLGGATLNSPPFFAADGTNITSAYLTFGGNSGGTTPSFRYPEFTAEIWVRLDDLTPDYEVIFETGGAFAGISALVNEDNMRFLGSAGDVRNVDVTIPLAGLFIDNYIQVVFSTSTQDEVFQATLKDTAGATETVSTTGQIFIGGNSAGLFAFRGGTPDNTNALGGRTEDVDATIPGLTGSRSEIAIVNIYDTALSTAEIDLAFARVSTDIIVPPAADVFAISAVTHDAANDTLTLTWNSTVGRTYDAQFLQFATNVWINLDETVIASSAVTTKTYQLPPNQDRFFLRIIDLGEL